MNENQGCGRFTTEGRCGVNMRDNNTGRFKFYLCPECQKNIQSPKEQMRTEVTELLSKPLAPEDTKER